MKDGQESDEVGPTLASELVDDPSPDDAPSIQGNESATTDGLGGKLGDLLDAHRDILLKIDDASRRGYSLLGVSAVVAAFSLIALTGVGILTIQGVLGLIVSFLAVITLGRFFVLTRQDARLRDRMRRYAVEHQVDVNTLVMAAVKRGRFAFFVKLFAAQVLAELQAEQVSSGSSD